MYTTNIHCTSVYKNTHLSALNPTPTKHIRKWTKKKYFLTFQFHGYIQYKIIYLCSLDISNTNKYIYIYLMCECERTQFRCGFLVNIKNTCPIKTIEDVYLKGSAILFGSLRVSEANEVPISNLRRHPNCSKTFVTFNIDDIYKFSWSF